MTSIMNRNIQLPWIEKYRPGDTDQILLDDMLLEKIKKIIESKCVPNMILTGEPGTGKTSTVLIIAREIFKEDYNENVLELNASDDRGLSIINNTIIPFCQKITKAQEKLIILDEADSITNKAQNLLSNLINEYKKNCRFVFVCNDSIKINESIQSKCIIVNFPRLTDINIKDKLIEICDTEKIEYTDKFINELIFISDKDIRKSINNLECIYFTYKKLTVDNIYKLLDKPKPEYIRNILHMCVENRFEDSILEVYKLYGDGYNVSDILLTFLNYLMKSDNNLNIPKEKVLELFKIISISYTNVQEGNDSLVQLVGCISNIFLDDKEY
jgi:replication factor C subunit 2/4